MYVIFPADELVYLSYGRLIYVPSANSNVRGSYEANIAASFTAPSTSSSFRSSTTITRVNLPSLSSAEPEEDTTTPIPPERPRRIKRENLISSSGGISPASPDNEDQPPKSKKLVSKNSIRSLKTPTKRSISREHSPKAKISPSTSVKSSHNSGDSNPRTPTIITTPVKDKPTPSLAAPDPAKYINKQSVNHLQLPSPRPKPKSSSAGGLISGDKRLSYSDFLPVHKCLKEEVSASGGQKRALLRPHSSPVDFDVLFRSKDKLLVERCDSAVTVVESRAAQQVTDAVNLEQAHLSSGKQSSIKKGTIFGVGKSKNTSELGTNMATCDSALKELTHPSYNEPLKIHNGVTFKLIRTVSDFTQQLAQMYEQHADELQLLVSNFRKRNGELRKERPACPSSLFHTWETLLQEVEIDGQALGDIASILGRQVSRPLLEKSFYRKIQSRKVFTHRESYETIIAKTEEKLAKCRQEYKTAYLLYLSAPTTDSLSAYFNCHNAYVQQLHATNGMLEAYNKETLPQLLQELEEIYSDLCSTISDSVLQGAEVVSARALEQCKRYDGLISQCKAVNATGDLAHVARSLPAPQGRQVLRRPFVPPQPPPPPQTPDPNSAGGAGDGIPEDAAAMQNENIPPPLKDELVIDRLSAVQVRPSHDALRKEAADLDAQIRQIHDALETMLRLQQRSVEAQLFNKANEIQEDISMKRFDLRVAQIHLSAINSQKELFSNKLDTGDAGRERKMSNASTGSMKTKWMKAFKSLKTPPPETEKKNGSAAATRELLKGDPDAHNFQEYTYKKITPCDVCSQVLRGHTRQGLRCRICKMNVHMDCQDKVGKCQTKAKLLRRQKSTSEIETKIVTDTTEEDIHENMNSAYTGRMATMNRQLSFRDGSTSRHSSYHSDPAMTAASPSTATGGGSGGGGSHHHNLPVNTIESTATPEVDLIYQVLKQAGEISNTKPGITVERALDVGGGPPQQLSAATPSGSGTSLNRRLGAPPPLHSPRGQPPQGGSSTLCVVNPAPCSTSSDPRAAGTPESSMRRRIFAGMKSLTGFGSRSRQGSPGHRSISLPEKRKSTDASGTRPFGQPLMLLPQLANGDGFPDDLAPQTPPSPSPSKGKISPPNRKGTKTKK